MRPTALLLCACFVLPTMASANELLKVYEQAVQSDASWRAAQFARDAAIEARPQARAALLPQLSGNAQTSIQRDEVKQGGTTRDSRNDPYSLSVNLSQPLFDWAAIQSLRQSDDQVALAETGYRSAAQDLLLRVSDAYFNVLAATDTLRSAEAENAAFQRQLDLAKARFEVGLSAITEVQEAQAGYDLTVATLIQAQQTLNTARSALTEITGTPASPLARLQDELPLPAPQPADIEAWVRDARENNLDVLAARLNQEVAETSIRIARAGHLPTVGLTASKSLSQSNGTSIGEIDADRRTDSERVALQLSLPIFSGLATQSRVRQALSINEQRQAEYEGAQRLTERTTRDAYLAVLSGAARVKALKQAVLSNTTALEAAETGLQVGTRTFVDVLNAQQQLYAAQRDYFRSRYDYLLATLRLKAAAGRLGQADLAEVDRLLVEG